MTIYYVATNGDDAANGGASTPWRTISQAMKAKLLPGDEVVVRSGAYNESIIINKSGVEGQSITVRSEVPGGAKIIAQDGKPGITLAGNYVRIDGLDVSGSEQSGITGTNVHHIEIVNNTVHDNDTNGIFLGKFDFALIEGNAVFGNTAKNASSGIHLKAGYNITGAADDGQPRIIVRGNLTYDNVAKNGTTTDANGISIDDFNNTQIPSLPAYKFQTLVENNITYGNTGRGVQIAWSDHVTVKDNLSYANNADGRSGAWLGELVNMGSSDTKWIGNVALTDAGNPAIVNVSFSGDAANKGVQYTGNVTFNGTAGDSSFFVNATNAKPTADGNFLGQDLHITSADLKAIEQTLLSEGHFETPKVILVPTTPTPTLLGNASDNVIVGTIAADAIYGGDGDDKLQGFGGADYLSGDGGADRLIGGNGSDTLVGGQGADTFIYAHVSATRGDVISDFMRTDGDKIDLAGVDANARTAGDQAFLYIGSDVFSGRAGELRYSDGVISGDVNGDKAGDFLIEIANDHGLLAGDFIL